jgi:hypothetical protein
VNPIVPFDAKLAARNGRGPQANLVEGGLPLVLSQTFRAVIHSRMAVGLASYRRQYRGADVVLFQPEADDGEVFFTNVFGYAARQRVCRHAYERTRRDLLRRRRELQPIFARHGLTLRLDVLEDRDRRLDLRSPGAPVGGLRGAASDLESTLAQLRRWTGAPGATRPA